MKILGIGEAMLELSSAQSLSLTPTFQRSYGGDVLNTLLTLQRLGHTTCFFTRHARDPFGEGLLDLLAREGMHTVPISSDRPTGVYFIRVDENGEREFLYHRQGSAASTLNPEDVSEKTLEGFDVLFISGITQAISSSARATTLKAARLAQQMGLKVVLDPNFRPGLWSSQGGGAEASKAYREVLPFVDVLLPSFPADLTPTGQSAASPLEALEGFQAPLVALKCAGQGVWIKAEAGIWHVPTVPVKPVDTTGAGDVWNAAFLHHLWQDGAVSAARFAHRLAGQAVLHRGALPPREMFQEDTPC